MNLTFSVDGRTQHGEDLAEDKDDNNKSDNTVYNDDKIVDDSE